MTDVLLAPLAPISVKAFCPEEAGNLGTQSLFLVKGWSRSLGAITCLLHAYSMPDVMEAGTNHAMSEDWGLVIPDLSKLSRHPYPFEPNHQSSIQEVWTDELKQQLGEFHQKLFHPTIVNRDFWLVQELCHDTCDRLLR